MQSLQQSFGVDETHIPPFTDKAVQATEESCEAPEAGGPQSRALHLHSFNTGWCLPPSC